MDLKLEIVFRVAIILDIIATFAIIGVLIHGKSKYEKIQTVVLSLIMIGLTLKTYDVYYNVKDRGGDTNKVTISQAVDGRKLGPKPTQKLITGENIVSIVLMYGCKDCEAIYPELNDYLKSKSNYNIVYTNTKLGDKIAKDFKVKEVPSAVISKKDKHIVYVIYSLDDENKPIFNKNSLDRIFDLKNRKDI